MGVVGLAAQSVRGGSLSESPLYPFLFASVFVLNLVAENLSDQVRLGDALEALAVVLLATAVSFGLLAVVLRNARLAAAITTVLILWVFSFGQLRDVLQSAVGVDLLVIAWIGIGLMAVAATVGLRRRIGRLTGYLNVASGLLVLFNLVPIVPYQVVTAATAPYRPAGLESLEGVPTEIAQRRPDIYYIILDRYPSQQTLASTAYDYDNSPFLDELERRGFYVAPYSHANYTFTAQSVASSLNMDYLDVEAMADLAPTSDAWKPVYDMLAGSLAAPKLLQQQGYTYVQIPSWFEPTATGAEVDVRYRHRAFSEFADALYRSTVFPAALGRLGIRGLDTLHLDHALFQFGQLTKLDETASPKFVFAHILLPHPPYVFGPNGVLPVTEWSDGSDSRREPFLDQLEYTNRRVLDVLDELLNKPEGSGPVVIIQADEGPYNPQVVRNWRSASQEDYQLKFGILNAYYLPGITETGLYPAITPVNTFRLLFNDYFGAELPLLEDRVYAFGASIYENVDITDRLVRSGRADAIDGDRVVYEVTAPDEWTAGASQRYEVTLRNTGPLTWESDGPDAVALRVRFEGTGDVANSALEQAFPLERDVPSGETARLRVEVAAPDADGEYRLRHRLAYGFNWFRPGPSEQVTVTSTPDTWERLLSASYRFSAPAQWIQGAINTYRVRVTNEGAHTWSASGARPVRLGVHFGSESDVPADGWATDDRFRLSRDVGPGESIVVDVAVTAPDAPGPYILRHRMVKENVAWFGDLSGVSVVVSESSNAVWLIVGFAGVAVASAMAGAAVSYLLDPHRGSSRRSGVWRRVRGLRRG